MANTYLLLAHFDIDKGSVIKAQYPRMGVAESYLAELMLPEGAHLRETDSTVFFLRRADVERSAAVPVKHDTAVVAAQPAVAADEKSLELAVQLFNFADGAWLPVNPVCECTVQLLGGAHTSPRLVLQSSKGTLLRSAYLSAETSFSDVNEAMLEICMPNESSFGLLFDSRNDRSRFQSQCEELIHSAASDSLAPAPPAARLPAAAAAPAVISSSSSPATLTDPDQLLCCIALVRTKMDTTARRGAVVYSIALCTYHRFFHLFLPLLHRALDLYFESPTNEFALLERVCKSIDQVPLGALPVSVQTPLETRMMRSNYLNWSSHASLSDADTSSPIHHLHYGAPAVRRNVTELPSTTPIRVCLQDSAGASSPVSSTAAAESDSFTIAVPNFLEEEEIAGVRLVPLLLRFREQSMRIFNALLAEKRVLFLGHHQPAALVCNFVLGACLMVSPPLVGCLQRAHPYATLTNMEFLKTPGYIAGVTNPIFETHTGWWDVCANMSTGEIHLSPAYAKQLAAQSEQESEAAAMAADADERAKPTAADLDRVFIARVLSAIESDTAGVGVGGHRDDEAWARCQFRDYTQRLVSMAYGEEEFTSDAEHVVALEANAARINAWKRTRSFATAHAKRKAQRHGATLSETAAGALAQRVRQLQVRRAMGADDLRVTLEGIELALTPPPAARASSATSAAAAAAVLVCEFLSSVPDSQGGLTPIAEHLMSADASARAAALRVLQRIDSVAEGAAFVCNLNYLYLMAYQRAAQAAAEVVAKDRL